MDDSTLKELIKTEVDKWNNLTAVHIAAGEFRDVETLSYLYEKGGDVNAKNSTRNSTPLNEAAMFGNVDCIVYLYETAGVDINSTDIDGETCLHHAVSNSHTELVEYLLTKTDINTDIENEDEKTPYLIAKQWEDQEIMDLFKQHKL